MSSDRPFGYRMQLFSQNGYLLTIRENGEILGTEADEDADSFLEIISGGGVSQVRIHGLNSNLYACFTSSGDLYGEADTSNPGTVFLEELHGSYSAYKSLLYPEWYIGIKKNGLPKKGYRTKYGQKAIKFLPKDRH